VPLMLPALRERAGDVATLAQHFTKALGPTNGRPNARLSPEVLPMLEAHGWPGNVRQLQNFIERLVVLSDSPTLSTTDVQRELGRQAGPAGTPALGAVPPTSSSASLDANTLESRRKEAEKDALGSALQRAGNNRTLAARLLGVSRRTLYNKLEEHGLL